MFSAARLPGPCATRGERSQGGLDTLTKRSIFPVDIRLQNRFRAPKALTPGTVIASVALLLCSLVAGVQAAPAEATNPSMDSLDQMQSLEQMDFLEQQIEADEAVAALSELEQMIDRLEAANHRYHETLVRPLMLAGDAQMQEGAYADALDHYGRARHISRVSFGLFDRRQIPLVYREAAAYRALGDMSSAGKREEYAYEVAREDYDEYDRKLLQPTFRLANFYLETRNPLPARVLLKRALQILELNGEGESPTAIPVLRAIARSHRLERFPPIYITNPNDSQLERPTPGLTNSDLDRGYAGLNSFHSGERALQRVVEIRDKLVQPDETIDAKLELADWHQMFGRAQDAATLYRHVWEEMQPLGRDADAFFSAPVMIYFPRPENPRPPPRSKRGESATGHVALDFTVNRIGRVRDMKTSSSQPPRLMDFRVRRSMRAAIYRPAFESGTPVLAPDQTYRYEYLYFPREENTTISAAARGSGTQDPSVQDPASTPVSHATDKTVGDSGDG